MQPYLIKYPIACTNYSLSPRPIVVSNKVIKAIRTFLRLYNQGSVPQAYLTHKMGYCSGCTWHNKWSNKWRWFQRILHLQRRFGSWHILFLHQLQFDKVLWPITWLSPLEQNVVVIITLRLLWSRWIFFSMQTLLKKIGCICSQISANLGKPASPILHLCQTTNWTS